MAKQIVNGVEYSNEFDPQIYAKIGTSQLETQADNLSDGVNELKQSLSVLIGQLQQRVTNLNEPLLNGCDYITFNTYPASASNKPTGNTGIIMTYGNGRFRQQVAFELAGEIYTRYSDNGSITAWTKRG